MKRSVPIKFVLFDGGRPGFLRGDVVVDISEAVGAMGPRGGQEAMEAIITHIEALRADLSHLEDTGTGVPVSEVSL